MRELYLDEVLELAKLIDFLQQPEAYGCRIDRGDPATYQERAGYIIDSAARIVGELPGRSEPRMSGPQLTEEFISWRPAKPLG